MKNRFSIHEPAHAIQAIAEGHHQTDGAAMVFSYGPEGNWGGGSVPSVAVDLAGAAAEIIMALPPGEKSEPVINALIASPLDVILQLGPTLCDHQDDFQQARNLSDEDRYTAKPQLQAMTFSLLTYRSVGLLDAIARFVEEHIDPTAQKTFCINPFSPLAALLEQTYRGNLNLLAKAPALFYSKAGRDAAVETVRTIDDSDTDDMVKNSITVSDGIFYPPCVAEVAAMANGTV